jgi:DNA-binding NarL/FixJ family response regulator
MRSTASAAQAVPAVWAPAVATVVSGDGQGRGYVMRLLGDAGFVLSAAPEPDALIVLLDCAREDERLREIRTLAEAHPQARILAIMHADVPNAALRRVLLAGASGIVLEDDVERALVPTARAMLAGQLTVPSALGQQVAPRPLSHREKQILALVMLGMTNREIAGRLFLAESTVKTHLSSAFRKIDARSRSEAVARIQDPEAGYGPGILAIADGLAAA